MAKKATPAPATPPAAATEFEPEALYDVTLARAVRVGTLMLRPKDSHRIKGSVATALGDAIASAALVE